MDSTINKPIADSNSKWILYNIAALGIPALVQYWVQRNEYINNHINKGSIPKEVFHSRSELRAEIEKRVSDGELRDTNRFIKFAYDTLYNLRSNNQIFGNFDNMRTLRRRNYGSYNGYQRVYRRIRGNLKTASSRTTTKRIKRNPKATIRGCVKNIGYARRLLRRFGHRRQRRVYRRLHNQYRNATHYAKGKRLFNRPQLNYEKIQISLSRKKADQRFYVFDLQANACYNVNNFVDPYAILTLQQYRMLKFNFLNIKLAANFLWSRYRNNADIEGMTNSAQNPATTHLQASMIPQFPKMYIYWERSPGLSQDVFNKLKANQLPDKDVTQFLEEGRGFIPLNPVKRYASINFRPPNDCRRYIKNPFQNSSTKQNQPISQFYTNWSNNSNATHTTDYIPQTPLIIVDTKYWKDDIADIVIDLNIKGTLSMTAMGKFAQTINSNQPALTTVTTDMEGIKIEKQTIMKNNVDTTNLLDLYKVNTNFVGN